MSRWREFFEETNGRLSSKRLAGIVASFVLDAALILHVIAAIVIALESKGTETIVLDGALIFAVTSVALGGLGLSTIEKHLAEKQEARRATGAIPAIPQDKP